MLDAIAIIQKVTKNKLISKRIAKDSAANTNCLQHIEIITILINKMIIDLNVFNLLFLQIKD